MGVLRALKRKQWNRAGIWIVAGWTMASVSACKDYSGACPSEDLDPAGDQFYLRVYNCVPEPGSILVNDRQIGEIAPYDDDRNECPGVDLGLFPQCGTLEIRVATPTFGSQILLWTPEAVAENPDGCYLVAQFGVPLDADEYSYAEPPELLPSSALCITDSIEIEDPF